MKWFISHQSALEFWRKAPAEYALAGAKARACVLPKKPVDVRELHGENPWRLATPLHILVGDGNARKVNQDTKCHVDSRKFPAGSFVEMPYGLVVSSPELCFVQMAGELSLIDLLVLGFELCGGYRLDEEGDARRGFRDDLPLTSVAKLRAYIAKLPSRKGHKNAARALRYLADGSASPMETVLVMLLTLPYGLGGYGFPIPLLNAPVGIHPVEQGFMSRSRYYCDLYWPDEQIDVEYDSDAYHTEPDQVFRDAVRRNALSSAGVTVITVSRKQVASTAELRKTAVALSRLFEKRLKFSKARFAERHAELRSQILPKPPVP